jgi:hypothetical protein
LSWNQQRPITTVIFRDAFQLIKNGTMAKHQVGDGVGLSVIAVELIVCLGVMSHWAGNNKAGHVWYALPLDFLFLYSVLSLSAIYLWRNLPRICKPANWLAFMVLSSVLLLVGINYIRLAGGVGIVIGIASAARSLLLTKDDSPFTT